MFKWYCVLIACVSICANAQVCDFEASKKAIDFFDKARFESKKMNYDKALILSEKALKENEEFPEALNLVAWIYYRQNKKPLAFSFFEKQVEICPQLDKKSMLYLANWNKSQDIPKAISFYKQYLELFDIDLIEQENILNTIEKLGIIDSLLSNPVEFNPKIVKGVSTSNDEYLASITPDGTMIFYTHGYMKKTKDMLYPIHVEEFTVSVKKEEIFTKGIRVSSPFNNGNNEGAPSLTADNRTMYFAICNGGNNKNCDIYYSTFTYGGWNRIEKIEGNINSDDTWESQPSISADGNTLYFSSNRLGGYGGLDLYVCRKDKDDKWGEPINLGATINTKGDEKSPFIHADNQTLYFSSTGHFGLGGYDIFYSTKIDSLWSKPKNIGYPINSKNDDLGLFVCKDGSKAYFSSNTLKGEGGWDLYQFDLYEGAQPKNVVLIRGIVENEDNEPALNASIKVTNLSTNENFTFKVNEDNGEYVVIVPKLAAENLFLKVENPGYAFQSKFINYLDEEISLDWNINPIVVGDNYRLNDIQFESNSFSLTKKSKYVIDAFSDYMYKNDSLIIAIHGYTDNIGGDDSNQLLSEKRASVVYNYMITHGNINKSRLAYYKGFGEKNPIATNTTEEGRAKNRRTIFKIIDF